MFYAPTPARVELGTLPASLFRALNRVVEPAVRAGFGNTIAGPGVFVVETVGRRSGLPRRVPLLGIRVGDRLLVGTVRRTSHWARNLEQAGTADVFVNGHRRHAVAGVSRPGGGALAALTFEPTPCRLRRTGAPS